MEQEKIEALRKFAEALNKAWEKPVKVCSKSCDQCLFTKNIIVSDERKQEILKGCEKDRTHFICHKGSIIGENIVCNGFYRNKTTPYLELMKTAGRIEFVDPALLSPTENIKSSKNNPKVRNKSRQGKGLK